MKNAKLKEQADTLKVNMSRVFKCDAKTLFEAISGGALFEFTGAKKDTLKADFRKGGKIHSEWDGCGPVDGEFLEISPYERIVFTWNFASDSAKMQMNTVVTVTIKEHNGKSTLTLVHDGFADFEQVEDHNGGWNKTFSNLHVALRELVAKLEGTKTGLDLYFKHKETIKAPIARVFHAVITSDELMRYFHVKMTGDFKEGATVGWKFEGHDLFNLQVHQFIPNEMLKFQWGKSHVCFTFREKAENLTEVTIEATGWDGTQEGLDDSYNECEGWREFLVLLRFHVESR